MKIARILWTKEKLMGHIIVDFPDQYRKDTTTRKPFTEEEDLKKIELVNKIFFYILFTYYLHIIYPFKNYKFCTYYLNILYMSFTNNVFFFRLRKSLQKDLKQIHFAFLRFGNILK